MDDYRESRRIRKAAKKIIDECLPKTTRLSMHETVAALQYEEKYGIPPLDVTADIGRNSVEAAEKKEEYAVDFDPFAVNQ